MMDADIARTLRFAWDNNMPQELKAALRPLVDEWSHLVPTWCHFVKISYATEGDFTFSTNTQTEYRRAFLFVGPEWLTLGPNGRVHSLVHELLHITWEPVTGTLYGMLFECIKDETVRNVIEKEWRQKYECAVEDLANALVGPRDY